MDRRYTIAWLVILAAFVAWEVAAVASGKPGRALSVHVWRIQDRLSWEGLLIYATLGWLLFWHFPSGAGKALGWGDVMGVVAGLMVWFVGVYLRVRGA